MGFQHVVHINMLGRVLYVRDKVIVLCDKCLRPKHWDTPCVCSSNEATAANACCVCNNTNTMSSKEIIDIKRFKIQTVHFCYKHTLTCVLNNATVYDVKSMEDELRNNNAKIIKAA